MHLICNLKAFIFNKLSSFYTVVQQTLQFFYLLLFIQLFNKLSSFFYLLDFIQLFNKLSSFFIY